jgi:hypothetical protein
VIAAMSDSEKRLPSGLKTAFSTGPGIIASYQYMYGAGAGETGQPRLPPQLTHKSSSSQPERQDVQESPSGDSQGRGIESAITSLGTASQVVYYSQKLGKEKRKKRRKKKRRSSRHSADSGSEENEDVTRQRDGEYGDYAKLPRNVAFTGGGRDNDKMSRSHSGVPNLAFDLGEAPENPRYRQGTGEGNRQFSYDSGYGQRPESGNRQPFTPLSQSAVFVQSPDVAPDDDCNDSQVCMYVHYVYLIIVKIESKIVVKLNHCIVSSFKLEIRYKQFFFVRVGVKGGQKGVRIGIAEEDKEGVCIMLRLSARTDCSYIWLYK